MSHIEDAMLEYMGPRCDEFDPECPCCQGWREVINARLAEICIRDAEVLRRLATSEFDSASFWAEHEHAHVTGEHCTPRHAEESDNDSVT